MKKNKVIEFLKNKNKDGKIAACTLYTIMFSIGGAGLILVPRNNNGNINQPLTKIQDLNEDNDIDEISLADTKNYKVIKVREKHQVRVEDHFIYPSTKYYIIKELKFPYSEQSNWDVKNLYALVDIDTNETVLYKDENDQVVTVDQNSTLSYEYIELGSLTDYLVKYNDIKESYQKEEFQTIIEKIEGENPNKDKINFYDTTKLSILEIKNEDTGKTSWHIVKKWPNPVGVNNNVLYNSLYEDIIKEKYILETDEEGEVVDEYKNYSYQVLGSLTDYLVTYNVVQPEYDKKEFSDVLKRVEQERKPITKELK